MGKMTNKKQLTVKQSCSLCFLLCDFCCSPTAKDFLLCEVLVLAKENSVSIAL